MPDELKQALQRQLWNIADTLRGKMNADEYRNYILGFIFYKYLSEKLLIKVSKYMKEWGLKDKYQDIDEKTEEGKKKLEIIQKYTLKELGYYLKPTDLFSKLAQKWNSASDTDDGNFILSDLARILKNIEASTMGNESEDDFNHLFEDIDLDAQRLGKTPNERNKIITNILVLLDKIDFKIENNEVDLLGDAYEYLIGQFAAGAGKKAGEFYTPQEVSKILAKIVTTGKTKLKSVYDPTCGSGSLLLRVAREVKEVGEYFGQELNRTTYNLARMNMILHGVSFKNFSIKQDDTLEHPAHLEKRFEAIVANPPFSAQWNANPLKSNDERFSQYGVLAPGSKADFAFITHMIHHLDENGTMAVVLPHGVLFRGWAEGKIREFLIKERNYLDAVIWLPSNIFFGTSIPACILVFKKCRENPDDIIFIDASNSFEKGKNQNRLRESDIDTVVETYRKRLEIEKYSHKATLEEIWENEYNLNIPRYVDTFEEEEEINIDEVALEIQKIENESKSLDVKIQDFCKQLWIKSPF
jgi:type I restriction enzyme M protein